MQRIDDRRGCEGGGNIVVDIMERETERKREEKGKPRAWQSRASPEIGTCNVSADCRLIAFLRFSFARRSCSSPLSPILAVLHPSRRLYIFAVVSPCRRRARRPCSSAHIFAQYTCAPPRPPYPPRRLDYIATLAMHVSPNWTPGQFRDGWRRHRNSLRCRINCRRRLAGDV